MLEEISVCLATLYLRGLNRPTQPLRCRWTRIVSCLRLADTSFDDFPIILRSSGFHEEALLLESKELVGQARSEIERQRVLTSVEEGYPTRWIERLKEGAPPAVWISGSPPSSAFVGIVGSRQIDAETRQFAEEIGRESTRLGFGVISGGATGSDLAGTKGALLSNGSVLEILPYGIDHFVGIDKCGISVAAPREEFSSALAMERNGLIYAGSENTVIIQSRFKEGGTWHGALEAVRRKLCPLIVRHDHSEASRALIGLGAFPISHAQELASALNHTQAQRGLFNIG